MDSHSLCLLPARAWLFLIYLSVMVLVLVVGKVMLFAAITIAEKDFLSCLKKGIRKLDQTFVIVINTSRSKVF